MTNSMHNDPTTHAETIYFRFAGGGIAPSNVRAGDVADMLKAAETLIAVTVAAEHEEVSQDDIILGLTEVSNASLGLLFTTSLPDIVIPVFREITERIRQQAFELFPEAAREALRKIATFTRKHRCSVELRVGDQGAILATIGDTLVIPVAPRILIQTTLYGRVINAGGRNRPNVHLETLQGQQIICKGTRSQVKDLGSRLYSVIGVSGKARCDVETLEIDEFEIDSILPYEETPIDSAISELANLAAPYFEGVDANKFVKSLRDDDSEE